MNESHIAINLEEAKAKLLMLLDRFSCKADMFKNEPGMAQAYDSAACSLKVVIESIFGRQQGRA